MTVPDIRAAVAEGLNIVAQIVEADAADHAPYDEGTLAESIVTTPATPQDLTAQVSTDLVYAVRQHEELDWHHEKGEAKYLENAVNRMRPRIEKIIGAAVKRRMGA